MNRVYQLIGWAVGIPIFLAIATSIVVLIYHLEGTKQLLAVLGLVTLGILILIFYALRNVKGNKLAGDLLDILYKNADPESFVRESEAAIEKTHSRALKNTLQLNLAVGYGAMGQYDKAIGVMKEMHVLSADKASKAIYYNNAATLYAEKGALAEGLEAYQLGQPYYKKAEKDLSPAYTLLTRALLFYAEGRDEDALDAFKKARAKGFDDRHTMTKLQLYEARTLARTGKKKEAKAMYGKVLQRRTYPYYLACAKAELAALSEA